METTCVHRKRFLILIVILLILACSACQASNIQTEPDSQDQVATIVAATMQSYREEGETTASAPISPDESTPPAFPVEPTTVLTTTVEATPTRKTSQSDLLPHTVYYLSGENPARFQVWRLERDGKTQTQLTSEEMAVTDFDVSPLDGSVAYLVNNQIYWIDSSGRNKQVLVDGGQADEDSDVFLYLEAVRSPRFSPDGNTLAYYRGGLILLDIQSGESRMMVENRLRTLENGPTLPGELFFPESWSPDGTKILVSIGWSEGGTFAILDADSGSLTYSLPQKILCCTAAWTADSQAVLISNRYLGMVESGLWRFEAATGNVITLLGNTDGDFNYADWVLELPGGDLQFFFRNSPTIVYGEVSLKMVHSASDASADRRELRPENFLLDGALWAPDGSLALVLLSQQSEAAYPKYGPMALLRTDGSAQQILAPAAYLMKWGP